MKKKLQKPYANQLKRIRKRVGFTQKELAKLIGQKTTAHISRYENGLKLPSLITALKICSATGSLVDVVFEDLHEQINKEVLARKKKYNLWEKYD